MISISVLMACYNRSETTNGCLKSLFGQNGLDSSFSLKVVLVDASSEDATEELVTQAYPQVQLARVATSTYWGSATRIAAEIADQGTPCDFHLWLNDDVCLNPDAIQVLLNEYYDGANGDRIVVGQLADSEGRASYGGYFCTRNPFKLEPVTVQPRSTVCQTFNGNVVLVPRRVIDKIGYVDRRFPHTMGDVDYGLRADAAGVDVVQPAGVVGVCDRHPALHLMKERRLDRLRSVASVRQFPLGPWWTFCRRHTGYLAPIYFGRPYILALARAAT